MTIEHPEPARRQLHDVHVLVAGVVVQVEADLVPVERHRPVDVADTGSTTTSSVQSIRLSFSPLRSRTHAATPPRVAGTGLGP